MLCIDLSRSLMVILPGDIARGNTRAGKGAGASAWEGSQRGGVADAHATHQLPALCCRLPLLIKREILDELNWAKVHLAVSMSIF